MSSELTGELRAFEDDHVWVSEHLEQLLRHYADQWIAVKGRQVIASDPDLISLKRKLGDPARTCIEFVTREPLEMIL